MVRVMQVRLFGELEAEQAGVPLPVRGAKQRALLALLALRPGQPVSADRLIDVLWGDGQAAHPANALQAQIGQLRRTLGPAAIVTSDAGYALDVGPDDVDVVRFEHLVAQGRRLAEARRPADASAALGEALGLRRAEPLAEFTYAGLFDAERAHLDELALVASESWATAELGLGRHGELAAGIEALCREHPLRERLWELLILALYRAGRQAEALRAYTEIRDRLAGELGIDPGPALRDLETRILTQHPSLSPEPVPSEPLPPAPGSAVPAALLETKLYVPRSRRGLVPRPRLSERLDRGAASKLMLVSAPAGFGKTTLLTEWLAAGPARRAGQRLAAWLSLDRGDNDPASFWTYVIAALRTAAPEVGESALALLQASAAAPDRDGAHRRCSTTWAPSRATSCWCSTTTTSSTRAMCRTAMAFLLDHLPARLHLVIASRADPALPLARLRARGELVEIRAAELRFTPDEAAAYLNEMMGLPLTAPDVAALEARTEGWIAALQLAALSMQGRDDVAGFIAGFAGDDRYVVDYLVEEVLQRQPDRVQAFLLQTSILGRLSGPLCDAVTGQGGGKAMLEALDRGNLFVVPLDDRRQWYRYHHLFADVLQARLLDEQPDQVAGPAPAGKRLVRAQRRAVRGRQPRAGGRRFRPGGGPRRAGHSGHEPDQAGSHGAWLARGDPRRGDPRQARAQRGLCLGAAVRRRVRGRRGPAAGRRAVARRSDRDRCGIPRLAGRDGRGRRGGIPSPPGDDRAVPGRAGAGPGRAARRDQACTKSARPCA